MKLRFGIASACIAWVSLVPHTAQGQVLQQQDFETGFTVGELDGQNGWQVVPGGSLSSVPVGAVTVTTEVARSGSRSVRMATAAFNTFDSAFAFRPLGNNRVLFGESTLVLTEAYIRYSSTGLGSLFGLTTYSTDIDALGGADILTNGGLVLPNWSVTTSPNHALMPNVWHQMTLIHNMVSGQVKGYVNGLPISSSFGGFSAVDLNELDFVASGGGTNTGFFDDLRVERLPLGTIRGRVQLGDWTLSPQGLPVRIRLIHPTTLAVVQTLNTMLDANGDFQVSPTVRGAFRIEIKPYHWTSKTLVGLSVTDNGLFFLSTSHFNGDCDGSDEVDAADIDAVIADFGASGNVGELITDIDGSTEVDAADIDLVIANFGASGS